MEQKSVMRLIMNFLTLTVLAGICDENQYEVRRDPGNSPLKLIDFFHHKLTFSNNVLKKSLINTAPSETPEISDPCLQHSMGTIKEGTAHYMRERVEQLLLMKVFLRSKKCYKKVPLILHP